MPRKKFVMDSTVPYHLSARSNNRDWFAIPMPTMWEIYSDYLSMLHFGFNVRIHSFVLMHNHFHLLASFPKGNLSESMNYFMRETSRVIAFESKRINHVYGSRIFRSRIGSNHYFEHAYKYVYRNPIEAGLCQSATAYEYSSLRGLLGLTKITFPIDEDTLMFESPSLDSHLRWINQPPAPDAREAMKFALSQPDFHLPKVKSSRKLNPLETLRY